MRTIFTVRALFIALLTLTSFSAIAHAEQDDSVIAEAQSLGIAPVGLFGALKDADPAVRQACARNLGETKSKDAVAILSTLLALDDDEDVRVAAIGALLSIDDRSALPAYTKALADKSERVRRSAASALSGLWDEDAQKALMATLKGDLSARVRQKAAEALGNPGIMGRYKSHHWESSNDTEKSLIEALKNDESTDVRSSSAQALGKFKSDKSLDALLEGLEDKSAPVRAASAEALGVLEKPRALDKLIGVLYFEKNETVLVNALKAVKYSNDSRLNVPVIQALKSGSPKVRWQAIDVLESIKPQECAEPLKKLIGDRFESEGVRSKAEEAIQIIGE